MPRTWASLGILILLGTGCSAKKQVELTTFDVGDVTDRALEQLDANKDGLLDEQELKACPGLLSSRRQIDSDRDGKISTEELQRRFQEYIDQRIAVLPYPITVTYRGQPLVGATVELIPEGFLSEVIEPAKGETDQTGAARPTVQLDQEILQRGTFGYRSGVYRVKVSKQDASGKELLPEKYNENTVLGLEVRMEEHMKPLTLRL